MNWSNIRKRSDTWLPWVMIGFGILLRLRQYLANRSLWVDEAMLARNILERSFTGLLQPLGYEQNAPVGFLILTKFAALAGNNSSLALRFFPFVFGILALILFYRVASHFLHGVGKWVAFTLFSIATPMVYYSTEFKQYMGDVFATVLLLYFFVVAKPKHTIWLAVLGAVILWFSHASLFILAAIALVNPSLWTVAVPVWLVSFGIDWWVALRFNLSDAVAIHWNGLFLLFPWQSDFDLISYFKIIGRMIGFFFDSDSGLLFTLLLGVGMVTLWKTRVRNFLVLMVPIGLVLLATGIQKYPFVPRLLLFLTPSLYIAVGAGFESILSVAKKMGGSVAKGLAIGIMGWIIFYGVVGGAWDHLTVPIKVEELGQVMSYLKQQYQANDLIYVYYAADAPFTFYAPQFGLDQVHHVIGIESRNDVEGYKKDLEQVRGHSRVWVIFSHIYRHSTYGEDRYITGYLDEIGKRLDYYPQVGASLYLYDLSDTVK